MMALTEIRNLQPDIVFHLAAQALVRDGYRDPLETYATNVMGTAHVLEAIRAQSQACGCGRDQRQVLRERRIGHPFTEGDRSAVTTPTAAARPALRW